MRLQPFTELTLKGFKSIRELNAFPLGQLNVLVGANGAGKSNLIDFFRMLRAMQEGGLRAFVAKSGGGDGFFFNGPQETRQVFASMKLLGDVFEFTLEPTPDDGLIVTEEAAMPFHHPARRVFAGGGREANLKDWKENPPFKGCAHVHESISSCTVYHVHDTSLTAGMRRPHPLHDSRELRSDCQNIAPFLYQLKQDGEPRYERIRETIQIVAPFFDDFLLDPEPKGADEAVRLKWKQKGSNFPFQAWQLSDGTIRFICLVTALLQPKRGPVPLIVIDEPELGLHPVALQVLAALVHETANFAQLLISTQSALLLDHFEPEHVIVAERAGGASVFRRLEREDLSQWLDDYTLGALVRGNIVETGPRHD